MMNTIWIFKDLESEMEARFTSKEEAEKFALQMKENVPTLLKDMGYEYNEECYKIYEVELNPTAKTFWEDLMTTFTRK